MGSSSLQTRRQSRRLCKKRIVVKRRKVESHCQTKCDGFDEMASRGVDSIEGGVCRTIEREVCQKTRVQVCDKYPEEICNQTGVLTIHRT